VFGHSAIARRYGLAFRQQTGFHETLLLLLL
jgi:hypothetical protein